VAGFVRRWLELQRGADLWDEEAHPQCAAYEALRGLVTDEALLHEPQRRELEHLLAAVAVGPHASTKHPFVPSALASSSSSSLSGLSSCSSSSSSSSLSSSPSSKPLSLPSFSLLARTVAPAPACDFMDLHGARCSLPAERHC
jgi:hypothetical protein